MNTKFFCENLFKILIPVAVWSNVWVCGRSLSGIAGSNLTGGTDICECCVLCK